MEDVVFPVHGWVVVYICDIGAGVLVVLQLDFVGLWRELLAKPMTLFRNVTKIVKICPLLIRYRQPSAWLLVLPLNLAKSMTIECLASEDITYPSQSDKN